MTSRSTSKKRLVHVEGLVDDVSASSDDGGTTWDQSFFLCPWNELEGELREDILRVDVLVGATRTLQSGYKLEGKSVRATVRELGPSPNKWFKGWTAVASSRPTALRASRVKVTKPTRRAPTTLRDAVLGTLTIEAQQLSVWRGPRGRQYEVLIATPASGPSDTVLRAARAVVARVEKSQASLRAAIAQKLLPTCNRWRSQAGERPVTSAAFVRALQLASISVGARSTSLIFECDELLEDHGVEVRLNPKGKPGAISLA
jgi:hypothetical protein